MDIAMTPRPAIAPDGGTVSAVDASSAQRP